MLENIIVILLGTKYPGNIGSVARAMHNMGLIHLRLVDPQCAVDEESYRMARGGHAILGGARKYRSLKSALRGIRLLVGTTGKTGGNRKQTYAPRFLAPRILAHAARQKVGILFGPEDTGLVDNDLLICQRLIRIPTHPSAHSINLAQAVMIVGYELFLASLEREPARAPRLAPIERIEAMYAHLERSLLAIGFIHAQNARHLMFAVRRMLGRAGLEDADVSILRGLARQIAWAAGQSEERNKREAGAD